MKLKQRVGDFRVRELLCPDVVGGTGPHQVYRVTKRKMTSIEAASVLASELSITPGEVAMAGLKDRQGITVQHMSVEGGRPLMLHSPELKIEAIGLAEHELDSEASEGNAFQLVVRDLHGPQLDRLRENVPQVRERGLVNYFDDQRFGNLRHQQGWIVRQLIAGDVEGALRTLLCKTSPHDDPDTRRFKEGLAESWGDWAACGNLAGRYGRHHSLFRHLKREPEGFAEAFRFVATRIRLIHLYAFQSHLWNRAVAEAARSVTTPEERVLGSTSEGPLVQPLDPGPLVEAFGETFRLPGPALEDVESPEQRRLFEQALAIEGLEPDQLRIDGVPGFQLIGEDRPLVVVPRHLRVRPPVGDPLNRGARKVEVRFEMPRGAYATLVVQRLLGGVEAAGHDDGRAERRTDRQDRSDRRPWSSSRDDERIGGGDWSERSSGRGRGPGRNPRKGRRFDVRDDRDRFQAPGDEASPDGDRGRRTESGGRGSSHARGDRRYGGGQRRDRDDGRGGRGRDRDQRRRGRDDRRRDGGPPPWAARDDRGERPDFTDRPHGRGRGGGRRSDGQGRRGGPPWPAGEQHDPERRHGGRRYGGERGSDDRGGGRRQAGGRPDGRGGRRGGAPWQERGERGEHRGRRPGSESRGEHRDDRPWRGGGRPGGPGRRSRGQGDGRGRDERAPWQARESRDESRDRGVRRGGWEDRRDERSGRAHGGRRGDRRGGGGQRDRGRDGRSDDAPWRGSRPRGDGASAESGGFEGRRGDDRRDRGRRDPGGSGGGANPPAPAERSPGPERGDGPTADPRADLAQRPRPAWQRKKRGRSRGGERPWKWPRRDSGRS